MEKERYIPLPEVQSEKVRFDLGLPGFVSEWEIGIALADVERLCGLAGIYFLRVVGEQKGEISGADTKIVGWSSTGEAYAGKVGIAKPAPISQEDLGPAERAKFPNKYVWRTAEVGMNMREISGQIGNNPRWKEGVRSTEAWVHYLDKGLRGCFPKIAWEYLVKRISWRDWGSFGLILLYEPLNISSLLHQILGGDYNTLALGVNVFKELSWFLFLNQWFNFIDHLFHRPTIKELTEFSPQYQATQRFSLLAGPELDRWLAVWFLAKTRTLVKKLEKEEV